LEVGFVHHLESAISDFKRLVESTKLGGSPATQQDTAAEAETEVVEAELDAQAAVAAGLEKPSEAGGNAETESLALVVEAEAEVGVKADTEAEMDAAAADTEVETVPATGDLGAIVRNESDTAEAVGMGERVAAGAMDADEEKASDAPAVDTEVETVPATGDLGAVVRTGPDNAAEAVVVAELVATEAMDVYEEKASDGGVEDARVVADESGNEAVAGVMEVGDLCPDGGTGGGVGARGGSHPPPPSPSVLTAADGTVSPAAQGPSLAPTYDDRLMLSCSVHFLPMFLVHVI
jgi:hypothetical protein